MSNIVVRIRIAWWFRYVYVPLIRLGIWLGFELDDEAFNRAFKAATIIGAPEVVE